MNYISINGSYCCKMDWDLTNACWSISFMREGPNWSESHLQMEPFIINGVIQTQVVTLIMEGARCSLAWWCQHYAFPWNMLSSYETSWWGCGVGLEEVCCEWKWMLALMDMLASWSHRKFATILASREIESRHFLSLQCVDLEHAYSPFGVCKTWKAWVHDTRKNSSEEQ